MEQKPYDRYATAAEMRAELAAPEGVQLTGAVSGCGRKGRGASNLRWVRYVLLAMLVSAAILLLIWLLAGHHR